MGGFAVVHRMIREGFMEGIFEQRCKGCKGTGHVDIQKKSIAS